MATNDAHPTGGHERTDISVRAAAMLTGGILLAIFLTILGMRALFHALAAKEARLQPAPATLVATEPDALPPEPRLQANPVADLGDYRTEQGARLEGYAWVDRGAGRVRIPIERAMELTAQRGIGPGAGSGGR